MIDIKAFKYNGRDYRFYGMRGEHIYIQVPWYEYELLGAIRKMGLSGVYVDVGANIGNHSLYFANHCESTAIYSFEPQDICFEILGLNMGLNQKKPFRGIKKAAWSERCNLKLETHSERNMGMGRIGETGVWVEADTLDNQIQKTESVVLIKIDVEGSEIEVLKGADETIQRCKPVMVCEAQTDAMYKAIDNLLKPYGYTCTGVGYNVWCYEQVCLAEMLKFSTNVIGKLDYSTC